jgi:hypothetical protein
MVCALNLDKDGDGCWNNIRLEAAEAKITALESA